jgi:GTP diphosphokinase / guanosine-3',5'-bis(diphosphate) 3'-diphosphatase
VNGYSSLASGPAADPIAALCEALRITRPDANVDLLRRAYGVAARCHRGQFRRSGDPYITHPVSVATILAGLGADDRTLCTALLHETVSYTPYTLIALGREFGQDIAAMVAGTVALDRLKLRGGRQVARVIAAVESADTRVVAVKLTDRLHNMQTIRFLPQPKQQRKARESLDIFVPVSEQLRLHTVTSELETLASATLTRGQLAGHGLLRRPRAHQRTIVALDIERSTSRPDDVKAELRQTMYALFDAALRAAGIQPRHRDRFAAQAPLVLVVSAGLDGFVHTGQSGRAISRVSVQVAGNEHEGRVSLLPG